MASSRTHRKIFPNFAGLNVKKGARNDPDANKRENV